METDPIKIMVIGDNAIGLAAALAITQAHSAQQAMVIVSSPPPVPVVRRGELLEALPFTITALPTLPDIWIDPEEPVMNYRKHELTCIKRRKQRKKRRRK